MPTGPPQTSGMNQMSTFEPKNHYGNKGYNQKISVLEKLKIVATWSLNQVWTREAKQATKTFGILLLGKYFFN